VHCFTPNLCGHPTLADAELGMVNQGREEIEATPFMCIHTVLAT
jgi:predicted PhzF superfamily epimerase YddE/YHI9